MKREHGAARNGWQLPKGTSRAGALGLALAWLGAEGVVEAAEPASEASCPPGAFCESAEPAEGEVTPPERTTPEGGREGAVTVVLPAPPEDKVRTVVVRQKSGAAPEIVSYETEAHSPGQDAPAPKASAPKPDRPSTSTADGEDWGLQLRASGSLLPRRRLNAENPSMGGAGVSLRYRPVAPLAIDVGMDLLMGIDSNGLQRREVPVALSLLLYLLPDTVVQPYAFFGVSAASAEVDTVAQLRSRTTTTTEHYGYIGGHAGLGLDLRVADELSIGLEGFGFVRERVDPRAKESPEFFDARTGQSSNTTVAGQLRGGVTFWW